MNKKLLTAAIGAALAAGPMFAAHADVKVYGKVQGEVGSIDASDFDGTETGTNKNGQTITFVGTGYDGMTVEDRNNGRIGVFATEDLGGGLKGIAKAEWKIDTTQGGLGNGEREAFVGLQGGWGTFTVGALKSPYKYTGGVTYDPFVATMLEARGNGGMTGDELRAAGVSNAFGHNGFLTDMLGYTSPNFGGFQFWAVYSPDENSGNTTTTSNTGSKGDYALGAKFGSKDWEVFAKYISNDNIGGYVGAEKVNKTADASYDSTSVGGKIKIASFTVLGQYETSSFKDQSINVGNIYRRYIDRDGNSTFACGSISATGALVGAAGCNITGSTDLDTYYLGADWAIGNNVVSLRYGEQKWSVDKGGFDDETVTYTLLGFTHKFSKTTKVWAGYRQTDFDEADAKVKVTSVGIVKDF